jgi:hypothetical protein
VDIYPFFRSDHSYVFLKVNLPSLPNRGPGVWKLNSSLLSDEEFVATAEKDSFPDLPCGGMLVRRVSNG